MRTGIELAWDRIMEYALPHSNKPPLSVGELATVVAADHREYKNRNADAADAVGLRCLVYALMHALRSRSEGTPDYALSAYEAPPPTDSPAPSLRGSSVDRELAQEIVKLARRVVTLEASLSTLEASLSRVVAVEACLIRFADTLTDIATKQRRGLISTLDAGTALQAGRLLRQYRGRRRRQQLEARTVRRQP